MASFMPDNDPDSFLFRLRHTLAMLKYETQQGIEDWSPTISRIEQVISEEEAKP